MELNWRKSKLVAKNGAKYLGFPGILNHPFWPLLLRYKKEYTLGLLTLFWVDIINILTPLLIRQGLDAIPQKRMSWVLESAVGIFALMGLQSVGRYWWRVYLMGASNKIAADLRGEFYAHLQRLPLPFYQSVKTGDLMSRVTNDVEAIRMAVGPGILVACDAVIMFVLIVPVMLALSFKLTLLALAFFPLVPPLTKWIGTRIEFIFEKLSVRMSVLSSFAQESFGAVRLIKSSVLETTAARRFRILSQEYARTGESLARYESVFRPSLGLMTNLGMFLILLIGGFDVVEGLLTLGTFVAFQRFVVQLSWPMEAIGWSVTLNQEGLAAHSRLQSIMSVASGPVGGKPVPSTFRIELDHVDFSYGGAFSLRLDNLVIEEGMKVGIVGGVGSGKSTLFSLLLRLYESPKSRIRVGGLILQELDPRSLRRKVASVEQQVFLFSESVSANIGMGMDVSPRAEAVNHVLRLAMIHSEIGELNDGLTSVLGEKGVNLSGGQKSRVALARALYRRPEILVLDDCFSAVDVEVENGIIANLLGEFPKTTMLIASHRMSVMPLMSEVWVLKAGRIVGKGTHQQLLESNLKYQSLWFQTHRQLRWGVS